MISDDILAAGTGDTMPEAIASHIKIKIRRLNKHKIAFKHTEVPHIGHLLTLEGVKADHAEIDAVLLEDQLM